MSLLIDLSGRAVKTLVLHISLAHRDGLPLGQLPPGHALTVQHTLHMLLGARLGPQRLEFAGCAVRPLTHSSVQCCARI